MTGPEFKKLRKQFGSQADVAAVLKTPLRTLQDWEAETRTKVPGVAQAAMVMLLERTDRVMADIVTEIGQRIDRELGGRMIASEVEPGWN